MACLAALIPAPKVQHARPGAIRRSLPSQPVALAEAQSFADMVAARGPGQPKQDRTLQDPHTVFQLLKRHYARYTPEMVEQVCGTPRTRFCKSPRRCWTMPGPTRPAHLLRRRLDAAHQRRADDPDGRDPATAAGQHRPARRRHPGPARPCHHPGLDRHRHAVQPPARLPQRAQRAAQSTTRCSDYIDAESHADVVLVATCPRSSSASSRPGSATRPRRRTSSATTTCRRSSATTRTCRCSWRWRRATIKGFFAMGQNPAVGGQNASFQRQALAKLDWLVVRDLFETETASFWKDCAGGQERRRSSRRISRPRSSSCPPRPWPRWTAASPTRSGWCSGTRRRSIRPATPHGHLVHRPPRPAPQGALRGQQEQRDRPIQALTWDYIDAEENKKWRHQGRAVGRRDPQGDQRLHLAG